MPKARRLTGIAALSAASLASVAVASPVAANPVECLKDCVPGQSVKFIKFEGQQAYLKLGSLINNKLPVDVAYYKLGLKFDIE